MTDRHLFTIELTRSEIDFLNKRLAKDRRVREQNRKAALKRGIKNPRGPTLKDALFAIEILSDGTTKLTYPINSPNPPDETKIKRNAKFGLGSVWPALDRHEKRWTYARTAPAGDHGA